MRLSDCRGPGELARAYGVDLSNDSVGTDGADASVRHRHICKVVP